MYFIIFTVFLVKNGFGFSSCERRLPAQQLFGMYFDLYIYNINYIVHDEVCRRRAYFELARSIRRTKIFFFFVCKHAFASELCPCH